MEINKIKLTQIEPSEYNPRTISEEDKQKLKNSLKTFGLVDPIIINLQNMKIIGGHQRYDVLLDMLMESDNLAEKEYTLIELGDIGLILPDEDLEIKDSNHEKALNLALNKISGEWEYEKLNVLLEELTLADIDITLTGFDDLELNNFDDLDLSNFDFEDDTEITENPETIICPNCKYEFTKDEI